MPVCLYMHHMRTSVHEGQKRAQDFLVLELQTLRLPNVCWNLCPL